MATAAIEGNTLSEEEVGKRIAGDLKLPPSKEYLGKEIDNVLAAANGLWNDVGKPLTVDDLKRYNAQILDGLQVEPPAVPGEIREHSVTVGRYRGAPAQDCEFLLEKMCEWLNEEFKPQPGMALIYGVMKAIFAHLYIAWIHPFGDGNGRTARMVEVRLLLEAGAPSSAAHLLSNYYNQTRSEYYRQLDHASKSGGDVSKFITYACEGLRDQLRDQISLIRGEHFDVTWSNYVHESFKDEKTSTSRRRRMLALAISNNWDGVDLRNVRGLSPQIAEEYAGKSTKTIQRDLLELINMKIITISDRKYKPNIKALSSFLPAVLPEGQPKISRLELNGT
ncbi:Fic family protein [Teichococcus coralli]|nr:Fic family protein [Pseudoroseomonas coralli]